MDATTTIKHWEGWLAERQWNYFATFTTRYPITLKSARRLMGTLSTRVSRTDPRTLIFWVAEKFELREGYHLHALIRTDVSGTAIWSWWFRRFGRAEVRDFNPKLGAAGYVAKYVTKELADYDVEISTEAVLSGFS